LKYFETPNGVSLAHLDPPELILEVIEQKKNLPSTLSEQCKTWLFKGVVYTPKRGAEGGMVLKSTLNVFR